MVERKQSDNRTGPPDDREVLVIRGRLDRAGRFTPGRCRSTPNVHAWPVTDDDEACRKAEGRNVTVETLDREGRILHRERAQVRPVIGCEPGDPQRYRVVAYIELRAEVESIRLVRGDLELWRAPLPAAPRLEVALGRERVVRGKPVGLRLKFGPRGDGEHLTVVYRWGERRFRPIYIGPPVERLALDLTGLPGGEACRFVVSYSNGLRSAHAATAYFRVPPLGPEVSIVAPDPRVPVAAGTPVVLEGTVRDDERAGGANHDEVAWLVDGREMARGVLASLDGLPAGRHALTLAYRGEGHAGAEASIVLRVRKAEVATAADWPEWDPIEGNS